MSLDIQILTILFSFFYGIFFSWMVSLNYRFIYGDHIFLQVLFSFLFVLVMVFLYFLGLRMVNDAILHPYGFFAIILGFVVDHIVRRKIAFYLKR